MSRFGLFVPIAVAVGLGGMLLVISAMGCGGGDPAEPGQDTTPAPTVADVAPSIGPTAGGDSITIYGSNFVAGATVLIEGTPATNVVVVDGSTITCTTPPGLAGTADVTVTTAGGTDTLADGYNYA